MNSNRWYWGLFRYRGKSNDLYLKKLKQTNQELAYEKQSEIDFNYADTLIQDFLNDI